MMVTEFRKRHDYVVAALNAMPGVTCLPVDGTFYAFPNFQGVIDASDKLNNDIELAELLLLDAGVALVPGSAFGSPGYMRLSFATSMDSLKKAMERIAQVLSR